MQSRFDAIVIGAGPAGAMAAGEIAGAGRQVLLLEKHRHPGTPLCCAEAVSRVPLDRLITPRKEWISCAVDRVRVVAPSGREFELHHPGAGYILDRKTFDPGLVKMAVDAGAELACETIGLELSGNTGHFESLKVITAEGKTAELSAAIFIAADGVESKIARQAGLNNLINVREVQALLQYRLEDIEVATDAVEFHLGQGIAPGSYIWVFPKSSSVANVGLGVTVSNHRGSEAAGYLRAFIERRFGRVKIAETSCGLMPRYQGEGMFRRGNLLVVGDAARAVDSFSGAGIVNGMLSGKYAGQAAVAYLKGQVGNLNDLQAYYPGRFLELKGEELKLYAKLRGVYERLDDRDFDDIVISLQEYFARHSPVGVNAGKLMAGLLHTRPRLIRLLKHLL